MISYFTYKTWSFTEEQGSVPVSDSILSQLQVRLTLKLVHFLLKFPQETKTCTRGSLAPGEGEAYFKINTSMLRPVLEKCITLVKSPII